MIDGEPPGKKRQVMENNSLSDEEISQVLLDEENRTDPLTPTSYSRTENIIEETRDNYKYFGPNSMPPILPSASHSVLFKLPVCSGKTPEPFVGSNKDCWDSHHVRMPFSNHSLYPIDTPSGKILKPRWELVKEALSKEITSSRELEDSILSYNTRYRQKWDFSGLHYFFEEVLDASEGEYFFESILPGMVHLALSLPTLVQSPIPLLRRRRPASISLTQKQVASLLANAFFCTFPRRNTAREPSEYSTFPDINFNRLFQGHKWKPKAQVAVEKLKCLFHYFRRVCARDPVGVVTFTRRYCSENLLPKWSECREMVPRLHISSTGRIEDEGYGMLQVDFANKFIGGGVLGFGCVQEEIQFLIFPELIVSRLFTEALDKTEALVICGCERYSVYKGYSDTFRWTGDFDAKKMSPNCSLVSRDQYGRLLTSIVAIDALNFSTPSRQYSQDALLREVNKAYVGFSCPDNIPDLPAVATGNWGCGVFHGDAQLKALLQLIAAAKSKRDLVYFTFGNEKLRDDVQSFHSFLSNNKIPVGELWQHLCHYYTDCFNNGSFTSSLYDYLYSVLEEPVPSSQVSQQTKGPDCPSSGGEGGLAGGGEEVSQGMSVGEEEEEEGEEVFTREELEQLEGTIKAYYAENPNGTGCESKGELPPSVENG